MSEASRRDHRRHTRVPVRQKIWCEADDVTIYVQALNVSEGGLFVRTPSPPGVGHHFRVSLTDPELGDIVARVEVVWTRPGRSGEQAGMGLRIVDFEQGQDSFRRFVRRQRERADASPLAAPVDGDEGDGARLPD